MNRWFREAGKGLLALLAVLTLMAQSVLPVYADTAGEEIWVSGTWENGTTHSLDYFDRIAVSSVRGFMTIRTGEEFSIWLPDGWEEAPVFSVHDDILVVSGKKNSDAGSGKSGGSAVVIGEDEPGESGAPQSQGSGRAGASAESRNSAGEGNSADGSGNGPGSMHEIVITVPSGTGLDTLRVAMESGDLFLSDITADSVTIQSGGGNLILRDVSLGSVDIYTEAGQVSMAQSTFGSLNIGMGDGEVSVSSDDELSGCRMELKTGDGEISYNGSPEGAQFMQPGNGKRSLTVQVVRGDISVDG